MITTTLTQILPLCHCLDSLLCCSKLTYTFPLLFRSTLAQHNHNKPSCQPSNHPTAQPTRQPSRQPTLQPFVRPSSQPSRQPTHRPSIFNANPKAKIPTGQPSQSPSRQPSQQPTRQPSCQPTQQPSVQPSTQVNHQYCLFVPVNYTISISSVVFQLISSRRNVAINATICAAQFTAIITSFSTTFRSAKYSGTSPIFLFVLIYRITYSSIVFQLISSPRNIAIIATICAAQFTAIITSYSTTYRSAKYSGTSPILCFTPLNYGRNTYRLFFIYFHHIATRLAINAAINTTYSATYCSTKYSGISPTLYSLFL